MGEELADETMILPDWTTDLQDCHLCEWHCGVDRTRGETGVCRVGMPEVASCTLHPAPPESYTIFMAGCNLKCLHCQNWDIAHYPDLPAGRQGAGGSIEGPRDPADLAREGVRALNSTFGRLMRADRLFFSGGESTCALPFVERVVHEARKLEPGTKVNFDTNGFATKESFRRILDFATSVTFDIRAVSDEVHRAMTGAPSAPVLRNATTMAAHRGKLWEYRILVVPEVNEAEMEPICCFLADLDRSLPVAFLAFRPNFVLERHPGASMAVMERTVSIARDCGLENAEWHGHVDLRGEVTGGRNAAYGAAGGQIAGAYAAELGCPVHPRDCGGCDRSRTCPIKGHRPRRRT